MLGPRSPTPDPVLGVHRLPPRHAGPPGGEDRLARDASSSALQTYRCTRSVDGDQPLVGARDAAVVLGADRFHLVEELSAPAMKALLVSDQGQPFQRQYRRPGILELPGDGKRRFERDLRAGKVSQFDL